MQTIGGILKREYRFEDAAFPFDIPHFDDPVRPMALFHWHDFLEISLVERGSGVYLIEDKRIDVRAGDIIVINNIERHLVRPSPDDAMHETVFHFDTSLVRGLHESASALFDNRTVGLRNAIEVDDALRSELVALLRQIAAIYRAKPPYWQLQICGQMACFIALALRRNSAPESPQRLYQRGDNIARLEAIMQYLAENHGPGVTLAHTARRFYLNTTYFSEYFKSNLGVSFCHYLRELRVAHATRILMADPKIGMTQVAFESGFSSLSAFYAAFQRVKGCPPRAYITRKNRKDSR